MGCLKLEINYFFKLKKFNTVDTSYNYRYYNPKIGRWMTKDPIEEEGGINLYAMVWNGVVNSWDWVGLSFCKDKCSTEGQIIIINIIYIRRNRSKRRRNRSKRRRNRNKRRRNRD